MIELGLRVKELAELKGWTAYVLSKKTGIGANNILLWFKSRTKPSLENIYKVCEALEITVSEFFFDTTYQLSDDEKLLIENWHLLSDEKKKIVFQLIDSLKLAKVGRGR